LLAAVFPCREGKDEKMIIVEGVAAGRRVGMINIKDRSAPQKTKKALFISVKPMLLQNQTNSQKYPCPTISKSARTSSSIIEELNPKRTVSYENDIKKGPSFSSSSL